MADRDPKVDELLLVYLQHEQEARDSGVTLSSVYEATRRVADAQAAHEVTCGMRWEKNHDHQASLGSRLTTVEARMVSLVDAAEITGEHAVAAIRDAAEARGMATAKSHPLRRAHDHPWWRRALDTTAAKMLLLVVTACAGWLFRHLAGKP